MTTGILSQDYTFHGTVWMTTRALEEEASGYFLVPGGPLPDGWRPVSATEGGQIWGKGKDSGQNPDGTTGPYDPHSAGNNCNNCPCPQKGPMTTYSFASMLSSLTLEDTPVEFSSPVGPQVAFTATYNALEANQPATFFYSNLGPKWDCSWLSYVTDNPQSPGADAALYLDGGGTLRFSNYNPATHSYATEVMSQSGLVMTSSSSYELQYSDGSKREYGQSDGSSGSTRRIFLTQIIDPYGNALRMNYDSQLRITNVVNAIGQAMTLLYTNSAYPFAITKVIDPFGRTSQLQYNASGLLTSITDALGLVSQYTYGTNQFITALTTPYGTTTFTSGTTNGTTYLTATDPLGATEAIETAQSEPVPTSDPAAQVPHGISTFNLFLEARDSFFWDKKAFAEGGWDWTKATIFHWLHQSPDGQLAARVLESEKKPLEGRVWYNYPGEYTNFGAPYYLDAAYSGASDLPSAVARVLADGATQLSFYGYNPAGNVTNSIDPAGRTFTYVYASNNVDLLATRMTHNGKSELVSSSTYNLQHQPSTTTDSAGQTTAYTYNSRGQVTSVTDSKNQTTTFAHDVNGFLQSITGPPAGTNNTVSFSYDAANRIQTFTDPQGYTVAFSYDNNDRMTGKVFPDGTTEEYVYSRLDVAASKDRLNRWTTNTFNADRQLVAVQDPLGRTTTYDWCQCGVLSGITDPLGRTTRWTYDIESRPTAKIYADGSQETYQYDSATGLLTSRTDPAGQVTTAKYYADNSLAGVSYANPANPTVDVSYTYDPDYPRIAGMQDGVGTTAYSYYPITTPPVLGAGQLESISGPLPNSIVLYQYDQLGRVINRSINGVNRNTIYDPLNRITGVTNALGPFQYSYLNASPWITSEACPNGQTNLYSYYGSLGDERLQRIVHLKPGGALLSASGCAYDAVGNAVSWTNQWDTLPERVWQLDYDSGDQLRGAVRTDGVSPVSTNAYAYDTAGNRTVSAAAGVTNHYSYNALNQLVSCDTGVSNGVAYQWDAAHRLISISQNGHETQFTYDGMGRRVQIVEKQGGSVVANNYFLWCWDELCEERDATGGTVVKRFYPQGESDTGIGGTTNLYYTRDHLGSVREALDSAGRIQTRYDYDPFGAQTALTQNLVPAFGYTGLYQHQQSGLDFAVFRGLNPAQGRWLNRDPLAESAGLNMYAYVNNNPVMRTDPKGELPIIIPIILVIGLGYAAYKFFKSTGEKVETIQKANKQRTDAIFSIPDGNPAADQQRAADASTDQMMDEAKEAAKEATELNKEVWTDKAKECFLEGAHGALETAHGAH